MADYQRFVSYLYEYQNNTKSKNCGFCRVELRDHNCRLEVHLKLTLYPFTPTLKVYVFVPSNEKLYGIFLGNASYQQGNVSGTFSFSEKNIKDSSYHFSQLGGVMIHTDSGLCFASAWKDLSINPERFLLHENKSAKQKTFAKEFEPELSLPNSHSETALDQPKAESYQPDSETTPSISVEAEILPCTTIQEPSEEENIKQESEIAIEPELSNEKTSNSNQTEQIPKIDNPDQTEQIPETDNPDQTEQIPEIDNSDQTEQIPEIDNSTVLHTETAQITPTDVDEKINSTPQTEPALLAASTDSSITKESTPPNFWETILKSYPQCHPFFDDEIHNCVQLSPKDVQKISVSGYSIENNAFFRHNCQSFQHFLIGKKDCSLYNNSSQTHYILAVPGIYNPKEQYMASMFGFPHFKCSHNSQCRNNCWGYWYRIIPEHWNQ